MRTLIAEHWGLSAGGGWVVVNGLPGEMNFGRLVATGFNDEHEAAEFIRMAATEINIQMSMPTKRRRLRVINGGKAE